MDNKEDTKAPCVHNGNSSTIANIIDIITTALSTVTEFTNFRDIFRVNFENVVIPSTEVQFQRQLLALLCTVNIVSASMKIVVGYSTPAASFLSGPSHRFAFQGYIIQVRVWTSHDRGSEKYSLDVQQVAKSQNGGIDFPTCFTSIKMLQSKQCAFGILEQVLLGSKHMSCQLSTSDTLSF